MNKSTLNIPLEIRYLLKIYFSGMVIFTLFRVLLLIAQSRQLTAVSKDLILQAFWMGFRFDTVVSCYILLFPALLIILSMLRKQRSQRINRIIIRYSIIMYCLAFFICCIDLPYYDYFLTRITNSVLNWSSSPLFMLKFIFQDAGNYIFISLFIILIYLTAKIVKKISASTLEIKSLPEQASYLKNCFISLMIAGILIFGIRGRVSAKTPIQWGTAFISDNNFINQLGLNPCFTFLKSYLNSKNSEGRYNFMDDALALKNVQKNINVPQSSLFKSPIARQISVTGEPLNANIVIVIMESMGLSKTGLDNNPIQMTPYLDSLSKISWTFTNVFSAGIHTYNGIYATLFAMPALMNEHPMTANENTIQPFTGIANTLDQFGYQSVFICPHDEEFDNMSGFLKNNGFQKIVGQKDFPSEEVASTMGVPDDKLFEHVVDELNKMAVQKKPFLASVLTGSDHKPIYIPANTGFVPKTKDEKYQIVEYADWSINKFLKLASTQSWYDNTIFIFVADHGSWYRDCYEMNLSYHKIPLLIFAPKILPQPKMISTVGGQIDVFPTIMGLLNQPYINNTMGVDLLKEGRDYICFSADDKLGCVNDQYFWYYNYGGEWLLHYRDKDPKQYIKQFPLLADTLKNYAYSMLQTTQWLIENKKVGPQN